jgi:Tol biopolymer transport system component/DNA-binding winged helix-turn-helix (wHTH) protein
MGPARSPSIVRFGDFEVDLRSRELRKRGVRIALQDRPLQVLEALLRTPGQLVSRETLRQELWPSDTFVDFDHGLNTAVRRLREALGDTAGRPRFVETLPRRGYRFIAPVGVVTEQPVEARASAVAAAPAVATATIEARSTVPSSGSEKWHRSRLLPMLGGAAVVLVGTLVVITQPWRPSPAAPAPSRLVPLTTSAGSEVTPTLSPDGNQVAFAWNGERPEGGGDRDIWVKAIGGTELRQLTSGPDDDVVPSWSPDGRHLVFLRMKPGPADAQAGIFVISSDGGVARMVGVAPAVVSQLSWFPDSRFIVAMGFRGAANAAQDFGGLQLIDVESGRTRSLTAPNDTYDMQPAVSADGRRLAYASCANRITPPCDVHVLALAEDRAPIGQPHRLTHHRAAIHGITWTGDQRSLVYALSGLYFFGTGLGSQLWRVPSDGARAPERLESSRFGSFAPAAAPHRSRLVFAQDRGDLDILRFLPPDGEAPVIASSFVDYNPAFSPDGRRIAFESSRSGEAQEIYLANPDGSDILQLTKGTVEWRGEPRWRGSPVWSPDGRRIVFASRGDGGNPDLWTVEIESGTLVRLTNDAFVDGVMTWSPDGKWIYYRQDRKDGRDIMRIAASGGVPERLTRNGALYPVASSDGRTIFFSKTEGQSPLFALTIGAEEREIVDCVRSRAITVAAGGLYYVGCDRDRAPLYRRDLATNRTQLLGTIKAAGCCMGLTVSPDGKSILLARTIVVGADLMLIEDFR